MKKIFKSAIFLFVTILCLFAAPGCESSGDNLTSLSVGEKITITLTEAADTVNFKMIYISGGYTFPIGLYDDETATVPNAYFVAETELTDDLWTIVHDWAIDTTVDHDGDGTTGDDVYDFANVHYGYVPDDKWPVDSLNWRDSMVWCNALTEFSNANNGTNYSCVYYTDADYIEPIRVSTNDETDSNDDDILDNSLVPGSEDCPYIKAEETGNNDMVNCTANGFRMLTSDEWALAARYVDGTTWNKGTHVSGDLSGYVIDSNPDGDTASHVFGDYAVYVENADDGQYNNWNPGYTVKSKDPNALGIYDMSGSLFEWCFEWRDDNVGIKRIVRGGDYRTLDYQLYLAWKYSNEPYDYNQDINLRIGRSAR